MIAIEDGDLKSELASPSVDAAVRRVGLYVWGRMQRWPSAQSMAEDRLGLFP